MIRLHRKHAFGYTRLVVVPTVATSNANAGAMREIIIFIIFITISIIILFIPVRVFERQDASSCRYRMLQAGNRVPS